MKKIIAVICLIGSFFVDARQQQINRYVRDLKPDPQTTVSKKERLLLNKKQSETSYDRNYYDSLIEKASKRHWALTGAVYYSSETKGFNDNGCSVPLYATVFGQCHITIKDIYLFSKLSDDNKVRIDNCTARAPERGGVPIGGTGVVFGGFRDDLYTTLLAPIELIFDATQKEVSFITSGIFRWDIADNEYFSMGVGYTIPFKSVLHELTMTYTGGELFRSGFVPDTTQRETSLRQFFREYSSVEDFIARAVLQPKGLSLDPQQRKSGIGDISLFVLAEYHNDHVLECGLNLVLPTASKGGTNNVWEPVLGNEGAWNFNPFFQMLVSTDSPYCNPFARVAVEVGSSFHTEKTRAPTLVTNPELQQVQNVTGLSAPDTFQAFYVDAFQEYDSSVLLFSDKTPCLRKRFGPKVLFGIGNYAYKLFHVDFRWGLFYDFYYKSTDSYCSDCTESNCCCGSETVNIAAIENNTDQYAHLLSTSLTYKWSNLFELGIGGQFAVLGKNIPKTRSLYCSLVIVF